MQHQINNTSMNSTTAIQPKSNIKSPYLTRSDNDVVDRNEDKLHEETNKSHDHETNRGTDSYLREFCTQNYTIEATNARQSQRKTPDLHRSDPQTCNSTEKSTGTQLSSYLYGRACGNAWRGGRCPWRTREEDLRRSQWRPYPRFEDLKIADCCRFDKSRFNEEHGDADEFFERRGALIYWLDAPSLLWLCRLLRSGVGSIGQTCLNDGNTLHYFFFYIFC